MNTVFEDQLSSSEASEYELANGIKDEYGAIYSPDGLRLLKGCNVNVYELKRGTKVICAFAFYECDSLQEINLPDSVTVIGAHSFARCRNLTTVNLSPTLVSIEELAFSYCDSLHYFEIPSSVTHIDGNPFGFSAISHVRNFSSAFIVHNKALFTKDEKEIIAYWDKLETHYNVPSTVIAIRKDAFYGAKHLRSITLPHSVEFIGSFAFYCCYNLSSITIPVQVKEIREGTFMGCKNLTLVSFPNSIEVIGQSAFHFCRNLSSIVIPNSVISIGTYAFYKCPKLSNVYIPMGTRSQYEMQIPYLKNQLLEY